MKALMKNFRPLCFVKKQLLCYHKEALYLMNVDDYEVEKVAAFPIDDPRRPFCFCSLGERLAHIYAYCAIEVDGGAVIAFNKGIYYFNYHNRSIIREFDFKAAGMRRPLNFFRIDNIPGFDDMTLCPDYSSNPARTSMSIYARNHLGKWNPVYSFPSNTIQHIHGIFGDSFRKRVLILTGDRDSECAIWEAEGNFSTVKKIIGGKQLFRACYASACSEGVLLITDAPYDNNYIYMLQENDSGIQIEYIRELPGPVVFFTTHNDSLFFSTTVECSEKRRFKYLTWKMAEGITNQYVHVYYGNYKSGFREVMTYKKDSLPMPAFEFGSVHFPNGECPNKVFYYPHSVGFHSQKLHVFEL